ncbi:MAG: hypothetical protein LH480_12705 [Rubrivivax sp.]|nr:hypothetical protein [Rubrivivax sp.]
MKHTLITTTLLAFAAVGAAHAQSGSGSTGAGSGKPGDKSTQMSVPNQDKGATTTPRASVEKRADVKAEAAAATALGAVTKGEQSTPNQGKKPMAARQSETTRAEVKAETAAAKRAGSAPAVGQESVKDQNKGNIVRP